MNNGASETPRAPLISAYGPDGFTIADSFYQGSVLIIGASGSGFSILPWTVKDESELNEQALDVFVELEEKPSLLLIGAGNEATSPHMTLRIAMRRHGIAAEVMSTAACCRTWNLVLSEGRKAALAAIAPQSADKAVSPG